MLGEVLHRGSGEVGASQRELEQAAQSGCGYSIPRGVQGQVGWDPGPDLEALVALPVAGGWELGNTSGPFQYKQFCNSMFLRSYDKEILRLRCQS